MKAKILLLLSFLVLSQITYSQSAGDYRSNVTATGDWSLGTNWEVFNGTVWTTSVVAPNSTNGVITISSGDSIVLTNAITIDQVVIESGGVLNISNPITATTFTLNNGVGSDILINGKLYLSTNATLIGSGTVQNNNIGILILENGGTLSVDASNSGIMNVTNAPIVNNSLVTNNGTFVLFDSVYLNTSTLLNNGLLSLPSTAYCAFKTSTSVDTGFVTNTGGGFIFKTSTTGIAEFSPTIKVINDGTVKGSGEYIFANTVTNDGTISPGDNSTAILTVNPTFITAHDPTLIIEINTSGSVAGTNYDQLKISTYDAPTVSCTGIVLNVLDNALDTVGTIYTLIDGTPTTVTGPFAAGTTVPSNFGNITFAGTYVTIEKLFQEITWDGGGGTFNWNDANNWNPNIVPRSADNVTIATGTSVLVNTAAVCKDLTLNSAGLVTSIQYGNSLIVNGDLTLTLGNLDINGQSLVLNGTMVSTGSGTITGSDSSSITIGGTAGGNFGTLRMTASAPNNYVSNFTLNRTGVNASATLGSNGLVLTGIMTLSNGTLVTGGNLTLRSSSIPLTGCIAPIGAGAAITGLVTVERFIPQTRKAYRDIAPIINSGSTTIFSSWQEGGIDNNGYGTHITGSAGTVGTIDAATGFDRTQSGGKSMYSMNISNLTNDAVWETINSTNQASDTLSAFKAYRISIRGNRQNNLALNTSLMNAPAILRAKGTLLTGQVDFTTTGVTANGGTNTSIRLNSADPLGFTMIGNPYPSPIDWETILPNTNNVDSSYWVFDPNMGTAGAYVTYSAALHMNSDVTSSVNRYIQPGQGFFIQNKNSTSPSLTIKETDKATSPANLTNVFRTNNILSKMYCNLIKQVGTVNYNMDGVGIAFSDEFNNDLGLEDADKFENGTDNLAINNYGHLLSIEGRELPTVNDTIRLKIWSVTAGLNYQLKLNLAEFINSNLQPVLIDRFTNTQTTITASGTTTYAFTVTADTNSFNNRFRIAFINAVVPITFKSINVYKKDKNAELAWTCSETNAAYYEVEHSLTGTSFAKLATVNAIGVNAAAVTYSFTHANTPAGTNFYRVKSFEKSGVYKYSNVVSLDLTKEPSITIYPNPIKGNSFSIALSGFSNENCSIEIYSSTGQKISTYFAKNIGSGNHTITFNNNKPASGTYQLIVVPSNGKRITSQLFIQ